MSLVGTSVSSIPSYLRDTPLDVLDVRGCPILMSKPQTNLQFNNKTQINKFITGMLERDNKMNYLIFSSAMIFNAFEKPCVYPESQYIFLFPEKNLIN